MLSQDNKTNKPINSGIPLRLKLSVKPTQTHMLYLHRECQKAQQHSMTS